MTQEKIDRINELARLAKERELTEEETTERNALRREYIDSVKASLVGQLDNTYIQYEDGRREKLQALQDALTELEGQLEYKTERWMYLTELKEKIDAQGK